MNNIKHAQGLMKEIIINDLDHNNAFKYQSKFVNRHFDMIEVIKYTLNSGKRLRPIITGSICNWTNPYFILFIEYIHNSSLIIDDLPCMDNDDIRRSQLTLHKKYGEEYAQLVAYNLMITAMTHLMKGCEQIRELYNVDDFIHLQSVLNNELVNQLAFPGLCGGQLADLLMSKTNDIDNLSEREQKQTVLHMIKTKTGCLFSLSFVLGWLANGGQVEFIHNIKEIGYNFGICYQIIDDLRDVDKDKKKNNGRNNICKYYTINQLIDLFTELNQLMCRDCSYYKLWNPVLIQLNNYLLTSFKTIVQEIKANPNHNHNLKPKVNVNVNVKGNVGY